MLINSDLSQMPLLREPGTATKEMLSVRRDGARTHVRINYSSLSVIQTCLRKADLSLRRGLRARAESPATAFGSAVHAALEVFYRAPIEERKLPVNFASRADLLLSGESQGDELLFRCLEKFLEKAEPLRALPESDKRSHSAGIWLLTHYFKTYIDDPFAVLTDGAGPVTERFCEASLVDTESLKITYFGTIDVVLKNLQTGVILPADHKTSSVVGADFFSRLKPNFQYTGYVWLARECLGLEADSFLVNCLQVKSRPVTARGQSPHFPRQVTRRTAEDIEEFRRAVLFYVRQYLASCESGEWPFSDVNSCAMYRGCQYLEVCGAPQSLRENILQANFTEGVSNEIK